MCTGLPLGGGPPRRGSRVYPRVYGATVGSVAGLASGLGLSPCVRGYPALGTVTVAALGSIPVCTGLPRSTPISLPTRWVYPRVYGATACFQAHRAVGRGLSPCVRGYHRLAGGRCGFLGSIPVCTGLPRGRGDHRSSGGVYPRVYGATRTTCSIAFRLRGLSPCVRGYRAPRLVEEAAAGSIPVCTGLPRTKLSLVVGRGVYPRVYGATLQDATETVQQAGLSPCVRGYRRKNAILLMGLGSIPVCTGLPPSRLRTKAPLRVYPRVYGATGCPVATLRWPPGLSPCVRGYHFGVGKEVGTVGSIPVCTGLPLPNGCARRPPKVYPRVYGATAYTSSM